MEQQLPLAHDVFPHIRIVMGMVIGLGVTRLSPAPRASSSIPSSIRSIRFTSCGWRRYS